MSLRSLAGPLLGAAALAAADQVIKAAILVARPQVTIIPGFVAISFTTNTGAVFGMFQGYPRLLTVIGILILGWLLGYLWQTVGTASRLERAALSLLLGGALGNLADRLRLGYVVDYIDVFVGEYHWPMFNLADAALNIGIGCLLLAASRARPGRRRGARAPAHSDAT